MQKKNPVLINVPHSSTFIPPGERRFFETPYLNRELAVMTDHFCDDLYRTGDEMLRFPISRLVCDPERFRDDSEEIMATIGMGAIYTSCSDGTRLKKVSISHKEKLLRKYYDRYHRRFESAVERKIRKYGKCLIIDGHSFYDEPLPYEFDQEPTRPDICIGTDDYHTPREIEQKLSCFFAERGYSVKINSPFAGSIVPLRYYRKDRRVMSVMIEINRGLYINHEINKTKDYARIKNDMAEAVRLLGECVKCPRRVLPGFALRINKLH